MKDYICLKCTTENQEEVEVGREGHLAKNFPILLGKTHVHLIRYWTENFIRINAIDETLQITFYKNPASCLFWIHKKLETVEEIVLYWIQVVKTTMQKQTHATNVRQLAHIRTTLYRCHLIFARLSAYLVSLLSLLKDFVNFHWAL